MAERDRKAGRVVKGGLREYVEQLSAHFGPRHWWPAETPFEVMVGAVLTQNTAWTNVERAIGNLRDAGALTPKTLAGLSKVKLEEAIKPSGYFRQKEKKLRALLKWLLGKHEGDIKRLRKAPVDGLHQELLALWGIGKETADSILCYALDKPVFVVDAYTIRVLSRHGVVRPAATYEEVQALAHEQLPLETPYLNEAHALFVAVGKEFCLSREPRCGGCPLEGLLPKG
jgi:endonuclease-3 related protein